MKSLIMIVGLSLSMIVWAQAKQEPTWKDTLRGYITQVAGEAWGNRIFGVQPVEVPELALPEIPKQVNNTTDTAYYEKVKKEATEYDRLPKERQRQFDYRFIQELYQVTRKTEARDEDLSNWLNTLDQGSSREGIYQALVLDEVYAALENMDERPSKRLSEFVLNFSQRFLNQTFKEDAVAQLNLYSLKRILSERALDLMEIYEVKDLDALYRWYAVFSGELAKNYGQLLKNEVREDPSALYHYEWAKSMPIQHLKSEFIIKLHGVMNGLQTAQ